LSPVTRPYSDCMKDPQRLEFACLRQELRGPFSSFHTASARSGRRGDTLNGTDFRGTLMPANGFPLPQSLRQHHRVCASRKRLECTLRISGKGNARGGAQTATGGSGWKWPTHLRRLSDKPWSTTAHRAATWSPVSRRWQWSPSSSLCGRCCRRGASCWSMTQKSGVLATNYSASLRIGRTRKRRPAGMALSATKAVPRLRHL